MGKSGQGQPTLASMFAYTPMKRVAQGCRLWELTYALGNQPACMKNAASSFALITLVGIFAGCGRGPATAERVHFVIPVGFRGEIRITEDKAKGITPTTKGGTVTIAVPANGQVKIKHWEFLFHDHQESASFDDGTALPDPDNTPVGQQFPPDKIAFWRIGTSLGTGYPQETVTYFVGTDHDRKRLR